MHTTLLKPQSPVQPRRFSAASETELTSVQRESCYCKAHQGKVYLDPHSPSPIGSQRVTEHCQAVLHPAGVVIWRDAMQQNVTQMGQRLLLLSLLPLILCTHRYVSPNCAHTCDREALPRSWRWSKFLTQKHVIQRQDVCMGLDLSQQNRYCILNPQSVSEDRQAYSKYAKKK